MKKGGSSQPGHEASVFHRVPSPIAAPAQHGVGPVHPEEDAGGQKQPGHHRPAARDLDPLLAGVAHHQRSQSEGKRNREAHVAEVKQGRVNHHLRVLQERIQAVAVGGNESSGDEIREQGKRRRGKVQHRQEENLNSGQNGAGVGVELRVLLVPEPQHKAEGPQQPGPQEQRTLLPAPQRGKFVDGRKRAVRVLGDVGDGKIVGENRPDQRKGRRRDGRKAGDSGPARGFGQPLGRAHRGLSGRDQAQCQTACQQIVGGQRQSKKKSKTAKGCHQDSAIVSRMILARERAASAASRRGNSQFIPEFRA